MMDLSSGIEYSSHDEGVAWHTFILLTDGHQSGKFIKCTDYVHHPQTLIKAGEEPHQYYHTSTIPLVTAV